eukprot:6212064-Pyramimonas_sp.AAC.1
MNAHHRRAGGPPVAPQYKRRLAVRGDLEESFGMRAGLPTCEFQGFRLVVYWAAGANETSGWADATSAHSQGQEFDG